MSSVSNSAARDKRHLPPFGKHDSITQVTRATASRLDVMIATVGINVLSLAMPVVILQVYDRVIPNQATPTLLLFILGLGAVLLLDAAFNLARSYVTGWSAARTQHILGTMAITRLLDADLQTVERVPPGIQLQRLRAIDTVKNFYAGQAVLAAIDLPFVLLFIGLIALIAGELALIPAVILLLTAAAAARSGRQLRTALDGRSRMDDRRHNFIIEVLAKIRTVKFLGFETLLIRRYERLQGSSAEQTYWVTYFSSMARSIGGIFSELTMASVAAYGSILVVNSSLSVGSLAACTFLAGRSAQPMLRAFGLWTQFQGVQLAREQVEAVLDLSQERGKDSAPAPNITGRLELRNVAFGYGEDGPDLLRNINLKIEAGETVGITGYNGSGKTTLLSLILGLLVPTSGHVLLDGMEPKDLDPLGLRSQICYIPQSGSLFHGTILENLTMFRGDEFAESAVRNANLLGLKDVIARLPDGYETIVGDAANDGLPGGVNQRIAIARVLARADQPPLILFDEANSSLDQQSDELLRQVLEQYRGRSTMVLISHRPSLLNLADQIYMLRDDELHPAAQGARAVQLRLGKEIAG